MKLAPTAILLAGLSLAASAQTRWTASAVTAVPHMSAGGALSLQTYDANIHGRGIRLAAAFVGESRAYVPVTAANGQSFKFLHLRAEDNSANGIVTAEFIRQPRDANAGPAIVLATVNTANIVVPADGFQFQTAEFPLHAIDMNLFSYYVRITLKRSNVAANPTAYDVSLSQ